MITYKQCVFKLCRWFVNNSVQTVLRCHF